MHVDPGHATSLLLDLPIIRARNLNSEVQSERLLSKHGSDAKPRHHDTITFTLSHLESEHVQTINMVMLDQAHQISKLVFKSEAAL
jgi:hypothetical protein